MKRLLLPVAMIIGLGAGLLSCKKEFYEGCSYHSDCDDGQLCNDNSECVDVGCTSSDDCAAGEFCTSRFECKTGCEGDSDCLAGETCNPAHECKAYGCRDTELDCNYGETCDTASGECRPASGSFCESCDVRKSGSQCGATGECLWAVDGGSCSSPSDCDAGYTCEDLTGDGQRECHRDFCFETCNPNAEEACPRGFQCGDVTGTGAYHCYADCEFMVDNGYL